MRRLKRTDGQRGATVVEFAIILPVLLVLLFGIIEWGIAFNHRLTVGNASQTAARVGTAIGNKPDADMRILDAISQGVFTLPANGTGIIKRVEVYLANGLGEPSGSSINTYNWVFSGSLTDGICDWSPCPDPDAGYSTAGLPWAPEDRNVEVGNLDVMGVRISFSHTWVTGGLIPLADVACTNIPTDCWVDTAIMRLEPLKFGVGG